MLPRRLLVLSAAILCVSAQYTLAPALQAAQEFSNNPTAGDAPPTTNAQNLTDVATIIRTVTLVDQKSGAPADDTPPGLPQAPTMLTALDGEIIVSAVDGLNSTDTGPGRRSASDYGLVFNGTEANDAAIQGTAYLTYTLVSNNSAAQGLDECLDFCDNTPGCVFVNIYYEFNNELLDFVFPQKSNLRCVAYGDVHTASEKANQQLSPLPSEATNIQHSSGYTSALKEPAVPEGYELVFGPISAANNAPGYMGFAFLSKYNPSACAKLCNERGPDASGGACKYFNIWRALVYGLPTTYICAMYSATTDASTALNTGQGPLSVTRSRGYARISYIADGGFEAYSCPDGGDFCFAETAPGWNGTSAPGGYFDATVFHYASYAHTGAGVALLGCAFGSDGQMGTLTTTGPLRGLKRGRMYAVQFFYSSTYSGAELEKNAFVEVWWNGALVGSVPVGFSPWTYFAVSVVAVGGGYDVLQLKGGEAPAYSFIDDVYLFLL
ncbi:hypothetical protein C8F04DRAFT_727388 [Mycena alexandri]|uniref:Fruit-body specific protein a n=1 Tax=Mycena alexandri TaxID=1745969 RepID=A0AAD6TE68_9AGAR|nr:hypothetical protein C8F04DRAFT_727388 [Mycena alexandri]